MKKIISLLLLFAFLTLALAACGNKNETPAATTTAPVQETTANATEPEATTGEVTTAAVETEPATTTAEPTTVATTTDKWEAVSAEVGALTSAQRTFTIELSEYGDAEKHSKNDQFVAGPDSIQEGQTPLIQTLVFERNQAAKNLLGVNVNYTYWDYGWGSSAPQIKTVVQGQAADAPDLFVNMIYDIGLATLNGVFKDTWSIPGSYFDFEAGGWMSEWMETMSVTDDRSYILAGDYFLDVIRAMCVMPFNVDLMDASADKLAAFILPSGSTMQSGEKLSDYFFDFVEDDKWTWEALGQLSEAIWVDSDQSGDDSIGDILGVLGDAQTGMSCAIVLYSTGEEGLFSEMVIEDTSSQFNGKRWIKFANDASALGGVFDAVSAVFTGKGSLATTSPSDGSTPDNPGLTYHHIKFAEGTLLFNGPLVIGALEDDVFQTMEQLYSVVPMPKVNPGKDYNTFIHNIGDAGAINVNTVKAVAISAFLQYCTENSAEIRVEFLEIVMKYKTTTYNQGTDRMLNIIYSSVINGRDKMIEDLMIRGTEAYNHRWHIIMRSGRFEYTSADITSRYQEAVNAKQSRLDEIVEIWYSLPKVEPAAE